MSHCVEIMFLRSKNIDVMTTMKGKYAKQLDRQCRQMKHLFKQFCKELCINKWIEGIMNQEMTNNHDTIKHVTTAVVKYTLLCEIRTWRIVYKSCYTFLYILYTIFNIENPAETCRVSLYIYIHVYIHIFLFCCLLVFRRCVQQKA